MIPITPQYKAVAEISRMAKRELKTFKVVYLRNGIIYASDGYMLSATKFNSNVAGITLMRSYNDFLVGDNAEVDENKWERCEGDYLTTAETLWTRVLKAKLHQHGKAVTIKTAYIRKLITNSAETLTFETNGKLDPVLVAENGVKSVIMPILIDSDGMSEWKIGEYD
jgi:hypothetical protein